MGFGERTGCLNCINSALFSSSILVDFQPIKAPLLRAEGSPRIPEDQLNKKENHNVSATPPLYSSLSPPFPLYLSPLPSVSHTVCRHRRCTDLMAARRRVWANYNSSESPPSTLTLFVISKHILYEVVYSRAECHIHILPQDISAFKSLVWIVFVWWKISQNMVRWHFNLIWKVKNYNSEAYFEDHSNNFFFFSFIMRQLHFLGELFILNILNLFIFYMHLADDFIHGDLMHSIYRPTSFYLYIACSL